MKIIPAILTDDKKVLADKLELYTKYFDEVQIDITPKTIKVDDIPPVNTKIGIHFMTDNIKIIPKIDNIIVHNNFKKIDGILLGRAINPDEHINKFDGYDFIQLMGVVPGKQGNEFQPYILDKIPQIRFINPKIPIWIDGGINDQTISFLSGFGIDKIVIGSYLNSGDIENKLKVLSQNYD